MADRFRGPRMPKHWHSVAGVSLSFTANTTQIGGGLSLDGPWTAIRMLGEYIIGADTAPTAQDACEIAVGIGVVSSDAFALGATAMPDPIGDSYYPWLYWAAHDFFFADSSVADGNVRSLRRSFDIRSMRKLKPKETLGVVWQYIDTAGAPPMQLEMAVTRVLVAG